MTEQQTEEKTIARKRTKGPRNFKKMRFISWERQRFKNKMK